MSESRVDLPALSDSTLAALLFAVDPIGFGGIALRAPAGFGRDGWLAALRNLLPPDAPWRRLPFGTAESRIFGGLDLAATLAAGRPVAERGLLVEADGGVLLLPMAERLSDIMAARLGATMDKALSAQQNHRSNEGPPARLGIVALDEGVDDEAPPTILLERLAFIVELNANPSEPALRDGRALVDNARRLFRTVVANDAILTMLAETGFALGVGSLRPVLMALKAACAAAALRGSSEVTGEDAAMAARLVFAPRATRLPVEEQAEPNESQNPSDEQHRQSASAEEDRDRPPKPSADSLPMDLVLAAAKAAIPPGLLLRLQTMTALRTPRSAAGKSGARQNAPTRGRPAGVRRGNPGGSARLNVIETLRAAAPWQALRVRPGLAAGERKRVEIRRDDLRITRFKQRTETTTIFVVDASGSLALNRLAEAKGAVELLLAECYIRRDQVALLAFRGTGAELVLPPTRSLTRAKRCLAELPGGGGSPLASGIDAALLLAQQIRRRGQTPVVVFLTDGRANVARDGATGRAKAESDATAAATLAGSTGIRILVVDASPRPHAQARALAGAMNAVYLPLPRAEAASLTQAVRMAGRS